MAELTKCNHVNIMMVQGHLLGLSCDYHVTIMLCIM